METKTVQLWETDDKLWLVLNDGSFAISVPARAQTFLGAFEQDAQLVLDQHSTINPYMAVTAPDTIRAIRHNGECIAEYKGGGTEVQTTIVRGPTIVYLGLEH